MGTCKLALLQLYTLGKVSAMTMPLSFLIVHQLLHAMLEIAPAPAVAYPCRHSEHCVASCMLRSLYEFFGHCTHADNAAS